MLPLVTSVQFLATTLRSYDIAENVSGLPKSRCSETAPQLRAPLRKNRWVQVNAVWQLNSPEMILSNGAVTVFLPAAVSWLLSVNHHRDGKTDVRRR